MPIKDPIQLFQMVVARMNAEDWSGAAGLCDPVSLSAFRRTMLEQFSPNTAVRTMTVDDYMKMSKDMPREVAEYHVKEMNERSGPDQQFKQQFPGVESVAALRALEPAEFFAEWLYGRSPKHVMREQAKRGELSKRAADALLNEPFGGFEYDAIGFLRDGDRVAHVVYRYRLMPVDSPEQRQWLATVPEEEREFVKDTSTRGHPMTFLCRRQPDDGWLAVADYQFLGAGSMFVSFEEKKEDEDDDTQFNELPELSP